MDNILVDSDAYIKLADFGLCLKLLPGETTDKYCGTVTTMAPEVIKKEAYRLMPDWWSVGIILYQLMMFQSPFDKFNSEEMDKH